MNQQPSKRQLSDQARAAMAKGGQKATHAAKVRAGSLGWQKMIANQAAKLQAAQPLTSPNP